jgi:hypothetical protein
LRDAGMKVARFNSLDDAATVRPQLRAATLDLLAPWTRRCCGLCRTPNP